MLNAQDFPRAQVINHNVAFSIVSYPAVEYVHFADPEMKVHVEKVMKLAVPFKTRNHGKLHKHFGVIENEKGEPVAYGKATSVSDHYGDKEQYNGVELGEIVIYKGKEYRIEAAPNQNIKFVEV